MRILVTGGAGYIGSVTAEALAESGHKIGVFDNLKTGWKEGIHPSAEFFPGDLQCGEDLDRAFSEFRPEGVCHLAAEVAVGESMVDPGLHYQTNLCGSLNLLDAMVRHRTNCIVFSSTAAVYGAPDSVPIAEDDPKEPINVYGQTKLSVERALRWYGEIHGIRHVSLRYFNACGASSRHGEYRVKETHIVPILLEVALGERASFSIFGSDYPTPDGTCIRDYIHVEDIADAHRLALERIEDVPSTAYNIGTGKGFSNREVVESVRRATGHPIPVLEAERRQGDPPVLVASAHRIRAELGWAPKYTDIDAMTASAWAWRREHPRGYG